MKLLFIVVVLAVVGAMTKTGIEHYTAAKRGENADAAMQQAAAELQAKLPMTIGQWRMEKVEYAEHIVRYTGTSLGSDAPGEEAKQTFTQASLKQYCSGKLAAAKVGVDYVFKTPSISLDNPYPQSWTASMRPQNCS